MTWGHVYLALFVLTVGGVLAAAAVAFVVGPLWRRVVG